MKRYVAEDGSARVRRLLGSGVPTTSRYSEIEIASALARRCREGAFPQAERDRALAALRRDFGVLRIVELVPAVVERARALLVRHPLHAGAALQLASCVLLSTSPGADVAFIGFDARLNAAASAEGLPLRA